MKPILSIVFAAAIPLAAQNLAVLSGSFATAEIAGASASIGILNFDGKGNVTGTAYAQAGGAPQAVPVSGTYMVASDGTGTISLLTQVATDTDVAPAAFASYQFLRARATGFVAIRSDNGMASLAEFSPVSTAKTLSGTFLMDAAGGAVAELGLLELQASGNLSGRIVTKSATAAETSPVTGTHAAETNGFWTIRIFRPAGVDEDGQTDIRTASYTAVALANGRVLAIRADTPASGLTEFRPVQ